MYKPSNTEALELYKEVLTKVTGISSFITSHTLFSRAFSCCGNFKFLNKLSRRRLFRNPRIKSLDLSCEYLNDTEVSYLATRLTKNTLETLILGEASCRGKISQCC